MIQNLIGSVLPAMLGIPAPRQQTQQTETFYYLVGYGFLGNEARSRFRLEDLQNAPMIMTPPSALVGLLDEIAAERDLISRLGGYDAYRNHMRISWLKKP